MVEREACQQAERKMLRVTSYDRAAALLLASLMLTGLTVAILTALWLSYDPPERFPDQQITWSTGGQNQPIGREELDVPRSDELKGMQATDLVSQLERVLRSDTLTAVNGLEFPGDTGHRRGAPGTDPNRPPGKPDQIPRGERWEIRYAARTIESYARQLDHFQIELAAVGGGQRNVDYAAGLTNSTPATRSAPGDREQRLYLTWRKGRLQDWDRQLLTRAGIATENRLLLQFYSNEVEAELARLEIRQAAGKPVDEIRKTVFEVQRRGAGYEFVVLAQRYR